MGKRNKKLKTHPEDGSRKIGDLFLARPKPKMAATPDPQSSSSDEETLDVPDPIPEATDPISSLAMGDLRALATKGDILNILQNLHTLFRSDMAILQEEVTAVTGRVSVAEEDLTAMAERQQATEEKLTHLQSSHQTLQARLDGLDDARHCSNKKIRGIADSIDDNELPQLNRRLFTILNPKQTKTVLVEGVHRLPKSPRTPTEASRDVHLRSQSTRDKMAVMAALSGQSPYHFEDIQLTFLQDLCRATLTWRRSVQRVTKTLRIRYRWGPSMLLVTMGAATYRLTSTENAETFLGKLGLKAIDSSNPTPNCSWDIPNIVPFVPRPLLPQAETQGHAG
ncbi:Hypothetical predicted protein [Pelobates cultripes]|uniref:Uncharacterized protein n=1 Tax=Pelobates cultripes TaxID=61616 RepID=A0AAD1VRD4_PELCU|nr:Hypothetical predicted protein [Pelobates cultripes]